MKILMLNYEYPPLGGGGATVTKELCQKLDELGDKVEIVTMGFKKLPRIEEIGNTRVHRVKCWRSKQRVCHPWEQLSYCYRAYCYIKRNLDVKSFDFVHCHFIIPTGILALWLKKKYGIKYVVTAHGSDVIGHNQSRFATLYKIVKPYWKKILKNASRVTAPSQYLVDKIHETSPNINVDLVPNGIDTSIYVPGEKKRSIVTLTRLQASKGVQDLIEACAGLDLNGWEINILGDGPYRSNLESLVAEKALNNSIHFRGHVDGEERIRYLREAAVIFSGSRFESFSLSVLEGSLCGCNVVASSIEPHIMLAGAEHTYKDIQELRKKILEIIADEPKVYDYSNQKYDWKNVVIMYRQIFSEVTNG